MLLKIMTCTFIRQTNEKVFLDTGFLIALESTDDQYHTKAQEYWQEFLNEDPVLVTTSYTFDEVITYFNSRGRHAKAVEIGQNLLSSPSVDFIHIDEMLFMSGWKLFQLYTDKRYSLTDCISFTVMEKEGLSDVLSFDHHFKQAGFRLLP